MTISHESAEKDVDRLTLLFRLQYSLFVLFYGALIFGSVIYFKVRHQWIREALGTLTPLPSIMEFSIRLHHPVGIGFACLIPVALFFVVWLCRPRPLLLLGHLLLMVFVAVLAIVPPVATEITTAGILMHIRGALIEKGIIKETTKP